MAQLEWIVNRKFHFFSCSTREKSLDRSKERTTPHCDDIDNNKFDRERKLSSSAAVILHFFLLHVYQSESLWASHSEIWMWHNISKWNENPSVYSKRLTSLDRDERDSFGRLCSFLFARRLLERLLFVEMSWYHEHDKADEVWQESKYLQNLF